MSVSPFEWGLRIRFFRTWKVIGTVTARYRLSVKIWLSRMRSCLWCAPAQAPFSLKAGGQFPLSTLEAQAQVWVQLCGCGHVPKHPCATLSPLVKPFWQASLSQSFQTPREQSQGPGLSSRQHSPASGSSRTDAGTARPDPGCVLTPGAAHVTEPAAPLAAGRDLGQRSMLEGLGRLEPGMSVGEAEGSPVPGRGSEVGCRRALVMSPPIWNTAS